MPTDVQQKTVRCLACYADGQCEWEFKWFPAGRRIFLIAMDAMKTTADLMGYTIEGLPERERPEPESTTYGVKGCPE